MGETLIADWSFDDGEFIPNKDAVIIDQMLDRDLYEVASKDDGWTILYRNASDGSYWERTFPHRDWHGGGPSQLRRIVDAIELLNWGVN